MHANIYIFKLGTFRPGPNVAATFCPGPNIAAIFSPTGQNMDATFGPRADIIWHGGAEYGSHIWSRTKFDCHNRSAGQFLGRTFCAVTAPVKNHGLIYFMYMHVYRTLKK